MSDFSVERKLQLLSEIRREHANNQKTLQGREQILYGIHSPNLDGKEEDYDPIFVQKRMSTFKLRFILGCFLFLGLFSMDIYNYEFKDYTYEDVVEYIESDFTFDFTSLIPYTTK